MYFDHNATAPLRNCAKKSLMEHMEFIGNASSIHRFGRDVRRIIESSRKTIAQVLGVDPSQIIFTSGATESNNLAIQGFQGCVIASAVEHDSVLKSRSDLVVCPVDLNGVIDLALLQKLIDQHKHVGSVLISVMAANNETGVIQPFDDVIAIAKRSGSFVHCDATQALGRVNVPWQDFDMISFSGHKIGAPSGVGCLVVNPKCPIHPIVKGGGQERSYRPGTENMLGIVAFGAAVEDCLHDDWRSVQLLRDRFESELTDQYPNIQIIGKSIERLSNTSLLIMPGVKSETQVINFDLKGIAVSAGSACSSGKVKNSHVLMAMALDDETIGSSLRISMGPYNTSVEVEALIKYWVSMASVHLPYQATKHHFTGDFAHVV